MNKKTVVKFPPDEKADHGDFPVLHTEMLHQFQSWIDEFCMREHGFKLSDLLSREQWVARLVAVENPGPEVIAELDKCLKNYREEWLPKRRLLDGVRF